MASADSISTKTSYSAYYNGLESAEKLRYKEKLLFTNGLDPYLIPRNEFSQDPSTLPNITYPALFTYLVLSVSAYTKDALNAYKGLQAYNQFVGGKRVTVADKNICDSWKGKWIITF
jgi:hypothetical protein